MNLLEQIKGWIGLDAPLPPRVDNSAMRQAIETGQQAKREEKYPQAAEALQKAMALAREIHDTNAIAVITMHQAEVFIHQEKWNEAEAIIQRTYQTARDSNHPAQIAYMLTALGLIAQARDDWETAHQHYEKALETAKRVGALGAEGRSQGHLAAAYLHDNNASYAIHLLREALPKLNLTGDIEQSSYFVGLLGQALIEAGQEVEGDQLLERALRLAKQMRYRIYERRWGLLLAQRSAATGRYYDAHQYLMPILSLFDPAKLDPNHVAALALMSKTCLKLGDTAPAVEFAQQAVEQATAISQPRVTIAASAALGMALRDAGQNTDAIRYLEAAASGYDELNSTSQDAAEIDILRSLGAARCDAGDLETAISTYRRAIEHAQKLDNPLELAQTYRDLGLAYSRGQRMAEAITEWTAALNIYDNQRQPAQVARLYCDIGSARRYLGQGARAMKDIEQALMTLNMINDDWHTRGLVLSNAANMYVDQGDIDSAEAFFNEAIAIARRIGDEAAETTRRGNYGWFLLSTGRPQQALSALEYALRLSKALKLDLQAAIQTDNLGLAYDFLSNYPAAVEHHRRALELVESQDNAHWQAVFQTNLANTLIALDKDDEATPLLDAALAHGRATDDTEAIVRALVGGARLALKRGLPAEAAPLLDEAAALARKADMRRLLAEVFSLSSEQQAALGQSERAAAFWEEARKLYTILHMPQSKLQPAWIKQA